MHFFQLVDSKARVAYSFFFQLEIGHLDVLHRFATFTEKRKPVIVADFVRAYFEGRNFRRHDYYFFKPLGQSFYNA